MLAEKWGFTRKDRIFPVLHGLAKAGSVTAKAIKGGSKGGSNIFLFLKEVLQLVLGHQLIRDEGVLPSC